MNLNTTLNKKYEELEEPLRFLVALLLVCIGFFFLIETNYKIIGAIWIIVVVISRIFYKTRYPKGSFNYEE